MIKQYKNKSPVADSINPRSHWPEWPISAAVDTLSGWRAVRPVPEQYALATDEQTKEQTNRRTSASRKVFRFVAGS